MMLGRRFPMLRPRAPLCLLALGTLALAGCGPGTAGPESPAAAARAMVRPLLARSAAALSTPATGDQPGSEATSGLTSVVLVHRAEDGTLKVGCVGSEDGAEALVRASEEAR
jgi:hypothetical protein